MSRTTKYTILALLLGYVVTQQSIVDKCKATYQEDINVLFKDCFDQNGQLVDRSEKYYQSFLDKRCKVIDFLSFKQGAPEWMFGEGITNTTNITCCDYYEREVGYVFTDCDQGVGASILLSLVGNDISNQYKNMKNELNDVNWNWSQLEDLVEQHCLTKNNNITQSIIQDWEKFDVNLEQWYSWNAEEMDRQQWDKNQWKLWLERYNQYLVALYKYQVSLIPQEETNSTSNSTEEPIQDQSNNFTYPQLYWKPSYNTPWMDVDQILADMAKSDSLIQFLVWYDQFYGLQGLVTQKLDGNRGIYIQKQVLPGIPDVPYSVDSIELWIRAQVEIEVMETCMECQQVLENQMNLAQQLTIYRPDSYKLPIGCNLQANNLTVCCSKDNRQGCYSFTNMNNFITYEQKAYCSDIEYLLDDMCKGNSTCFREELYEWFKSSGDIQLYAWHYFDANQGAQTYSKCRQTSESFPSNSSIIYSAFEYPFGNLNNN